MKIPRNWKYFSSLGIGFILMYIAFVALFFIDFRSHCSGDNLCQLGALIPLIPLIILGSLPPFRYMMDPLSDGLIIGFILWVIVLYLLGYSIERIVRHTKSPKKSKTKSFVNGFAIPFFYVLCGFGIYFLIVSIISRLVD